MAKAKKSPKGALADALVLQQQSQVKPQHCGLWFHSSKDKRTELVEHPDPSFFSRSPQGWTGWGGHHANDPILVAVVIEPLSPNSVVRAPFVSGGDKDGFEKGEPLPGWWLVLANEDIEKVMIVDEYWQSDAQKVHEYSGTAEYIAMRQKAVEELIDAIAQRKAQLEQAKAAQAKKSS